MAELPLWYTKSTNPEAFHVQYSAWINDQFSIIRLCYRSLFMSKQYCRCFLHRVVVFLVQTITGRTWTIPFTIHTTPLGGTWKNPSKQIDIKTARACLSLHIFLYQCIDWPIQYQQEIPRCPLVFVDRCKMKWRSAPDSGICKCCYWWLIGRKVILRHLQ